MSIPRLTSKCALFGFAAAFLIASFPLDIPAEEFRSPSDGIQSMKYEDGRVSLEAKDASLDKVLSELARMAMLTVIADGPIEGRITIYADRLPLEKALRKILRGKDTSIVYTAKAETSPTEYEILEVRIYVAEAGKGPSRRYSYSKKREERDSASRSPRAPNARARSRGTSRRIPGASRSVPPIASTEEAQKLMSDLMEGNIGGLDRIAEKLKEDNPDVEEQIEEFLDNLEDMRMRAEESGSPFPPIEGLGDMRNMMKDLLDKGRPPPGQEW